MQVNRRLPGESEEEARARIRQERGDYRTREEIASDRTDEAIQSQDRIINRLTVNKHDKKRGN